MHIEFLGLFLNTDRALRKPSYLNVLSPQIFLRKLVSVCKCVVSQELIYVSYKMDVYKEPLLELKPVFHCLMLLVAPCKIPRLLERTLSLSPSQVCLVTTLFLDITLICQHYKELCPLRGWQYHNCQGLIMIYGHKVAFNSTT